MFLFWYLKPHGHMAMLRFERYLIHIQRGLPFSGRAAINEVYKNAWTLSFCIFDSLLRKTSTIFFEEKKKKNPYYSRNRGSPALLIISGVRLCCRHDCRRGSYHDRRGFRPVGVRLGVLDVRHNRLACRWTHDGRLWLCLLRCRWRRP